MFAAAQQLSGSSGSTSGSNVGATKESGEPQLAGNAGGASVWYAWTPAAGGSTTITTGGSGFDTLLGVYTGSSVSTLSLVASNDDVSSSDRTSSVTFTASAGTTYMITVDGYNGPRSGQAAGTIALGWSQASSSPTPPPPASSAPPNDMFAAAQQLSGSSGSTSGSNVGATKESGEPQLAGNSGGASVWYSWTAPAAGATTVKTAGSGFDTLLGVYTGSSVSALSLVASNDDVSSSDTTSSVTFTATAGTTYMITVDGYNGSRSGQAAGSVSLTWAGQSGSTPTPPPPSAPANDMFANAQTVSGLSGSATGSNVGATKEQGEPAIAGDPGGASVWYAWTPSADGSATVTTSGASFATLLGVYTGSTVSTLTLVGGSNTGSVTFAATGGTTYRIAVDGRGGATGTFSLGWSQSAATTSPPPPPATGPANDMFADAQSLSGSSGSASGSNVGATKEAGEPTVAGNGGGASVWYSWTAPAAGTTTVKTAGSGFDTLLGVYTGSSVSALSLVASNDDVSSSDRTSAVTFTASAGRTYMVVVDGYHGSSSGQASGSIALAWSLAGSTAPPPSGPPNDMFADAQTVSGTSGSATGSNVGATKESGEPAIAGNSGGASVWYRWTAGSDGTVSATTSGSSFDTLLAVYTGSSVSALTLVASNDDVSSSDRTSAVTFSAVAGTTYMVAVDGYRGSSSGQATGSVALAWSQSAPPPPPPPQPAGDPQLLAAGDVAYCPNGPAASGAAQTASLVEQFAGVPVALLGDGAYDSGTATEYASCYDPTWGAFRDRTHPAPGYHDYVTANASGYFGYFGSAAGTAGQGWYSYDLGTWHVIVLNAPLCDRSCGSTSAQIQWLQSDLAAHPAQCTLAYWSYPLFTSGTTDGPDPAMKSFWTVLYSKGVDVVLNGHEHSYERFAPQDPSAHADSAHGIREFVVGTGGKQEYGFGRTAANSQVRYNATLGVLKLTLHPGSYDWQYLPTSGSFADSGSTSCH